MSLSLYSISSSRSSPAFLEKYPRLPKNTSETITIIVDTAPSTYMPQPMAIPTPTVAQIPAEVVIPLTLLLRKKIIPEPINPTAVTIPAATRDGSRRTYSPRTSLKPYLEMIIMVAAATEMMTCVLTPAVFFRLCRS